jgi:hypothetical protein
MITHDLFMKNLCLQPGFQSALMRVMLYLPLTMYWLELFALRFGVSDVDFV